MRSLKKQPVQSPPVVVSKLPAGSVVYFGGEIFVSEVDAQKDRERVAGEALIALRVASKRR